MSPNLAEFYNRAAQLRQLIETQEHELTNILSAYETPETIRDELDRSIKTLDGLTKEFEPITEPLSGLKVSTFFPLNLPLYSLVLFGVAPSAFADNVYIRPPEIMQHILKQLWPVLHLGDIFPNISLKSTPRHIFVELYAKESDVIIFTGKHTNALDIHSKCPGSMLLYNGSGINPFLVFKNADIDLATTKAVEMRCFNSGQDCAGPDGFIIPSELSDEFSAQLIKKLANVEIGPTMKIAYIDELEEWLMHRAQTQILLKGEIDRKNRLVQPTVMLDYLSDVEEVHFHEFFAPVFYLLVYRSDDELKRLLQSQEFKDKSMYISVFGDNPTIEEDIKSAKILKNKIVNDVEYGNEEYGGYGDKSNFVLLDGKKTTKPILISRDMHLFLAPGTYRDSGKSS